jgi:hypothetical protein
LICLSLLTVGTSHRIRRWGKGIGLAWLAGTIIIAFFTDLSVAILFWMLEVKPAFFGGVTVLPAIGVILLSNRYILSTEEPTAHGHEPVVFSTRPTIFSWDITRPA